MYVHLLGIKNSAMSAIIKLLRNNMTKTPIDAFEQVTVSASVRTTVRGIRTAIRLIGEYIFQLGLLHAKKAHFEGHAANITISFSCGILVRLVDLSFNCPQF